MALTGTLFTGLSGLTTNQTRMNVVGNNIANVNTTAFKSSRALFTTEAYVTNDAGGPPTGDSGGTNPSQIGLGSTVSSIDTDYSEGSIQATGKASDMAINGDGFFVIKNADGQRYTRDGSFSLNSNQQLVTSAGAFVQGYGANSDGVIDTTKLQNITIPLGTQVAAQATSTVTMSGTLDAAGNTTLAATSYSTQALEATGGGTIDATTLLTNVESAANPGTPLFSTSPPASTLTLNATQGTNNTSIPTATFTVTPTSTVGDLLSFYNHSLGIDTAAPAVGGVSPGATIDPTGTQIVINGNVGTANGFTLGTQAVKDGTGASPLGFTSGTTASGESQNISVTAYDSLGQPVNINVTAVYDSKTSTGGTTWRFFASSPNNSNGNLSIGDGTVTFDSNGQYVSATNNTIDIDRTGTGAAPTMPVTLDFSDVQAVSQSTNIKATADGAPVGSLVSYSVGTDGVITGTFSNNVNKSLGQIALAKFNNPQGLVDDGGNVYNSAANSGAAEIGTPNGIDAGTIEGASLEGSNVDLSTEFINLIVASTGFTAASRVITTSNQLLTELLNTTR